MTIHEYVLHTVADTPHLGLCQFSSHFPKGKNKVQKGKSVKGLKGKEYAYLDVPLSDLSSVDF